MTYVQLQEEPKEKWDRGSALTSGAHSGASTKVGTRWWTKTCVHYPCGLSANRSQNSPHQAETQAIVSFQRTKGNNLVRFLLLSTHTRSVCPRCVSLDSAHLAYEPLQTGFLCFYCRPTTLLIRMWTLLLSWCSQEKKKNKKNSKPKVNSEPAKPPSELIKMEKYCQERFCRNICIKWKILELAFLYEKVYLAASARSPCKNVSWGWRWSSARSSWTRLGWSAGCSALCNSMMHLIGEFVLRVKWIPEVVCRKATFIMKLADALQTKNLFLKARIWIWPPPRLVKLWRRSAPSDCG